QIFDSLSVREKSGVDLIKRLVNRDAAWMPDPTLLNENYPEAQKPAENRAPYLFSYVLRSGADSLTVQRTVADKLGLDIVSPSVTHQRWRTLGEIVHPTPLEWIGYIQESSFVVTNSFHG